MVTTELDAPYELAEEAVERFRRDGFVHLRDVLATKTLERCSEEITAKVVKINTMHLPLEERSTYDKAFVQVTNIWTDWHVDEYYWPLSGELTATARTPLQDTPVETGPLSFALGSPSFAALRPVDQRRLRSSDPGGDESSTDPIAYAPYLRGGLAPVLVQVARGDQTVPNPSASAFLAGDLAERATFLRYDLAFAVDAGLQKNPHPFLQQTVPPATAFQRQLGIWAQEHAATFFASDGASEIGGRRPAVLRAAERRGGAPRGAGVHSVGPAPVHAGRAASSAASSLANRPASSVRERTPSLR